MNEYLVQAVAREQLNDRIAAARGAGQARRSSGRARRARRGGSAHAASSHGAPGGARAARVASPLSRAGHHFAQDVRHPVDTFLTWFAAGQL